MSVTLVLTDDRERSRRLMSRTRKLGAWALHDLYDDAPPPPSPRIIVSDLLKPSSETIARLRRCLAGLRGPRTPLVWLLHENSAREHLQARAVDASRLVTARSLLDDAAPTGDDAGPRKPPSVLRDAALRAGEILGGVIHGGRAVDPASVGTGASLVLDAVRAEGVREWLALVGHFDDATLRHCLVVAGLGAAFALRLSLGAADADRMVQATLLHDVGKSRVPRGILNKPGPLDADERRVMREHAARGHAMLQGSAFDPSLLGVVRSHHELLDGSGYPDRLAGDAIPDLVRLVTICDVFAALIERRPYRAPMSGEAALATLLGMDGRLDMDLVRAFRAVAEAA